MHYRAQEGQAGIETTVNPAPPLSPHGRWVMQWGGADPRSNPSYSCLTVECSTSPGSSLLTGRPRSLGTLSEMPTLQPLGQAGAQKMLSPYSPLLISHYYI